MWLLTQSLSALFWVVYGSFFEWYWHKLWMHTPRFPKEAFHGHTIVHHGIYGKDESFFLEEGEHPEHILLKPYALPGIFLAHLPIMFLIQKYLVANTLLGGIVACVGYFTIYEYMHWNMHVPRGQFVERFRWFQFLRAHHKLHHRYYQKNFCVLLPLADWCLGTLMTEEMLAQRRAEREEAIAKGETYSEKPSRRRVVRFENPAETEPTDKLALSRQYDKFKAPRRRAKPRKDWNLQQVRDVLLSGKNRRDR